MIVPRMPGMTAVTTASFRLFSKPDRYSAVSGVVPRMV